MIAALAAPALVLALAFHGGATAVLLAAAAPIAVGAAIARRARAEEARQGAARAMLADTLTEHLARGERARIARELHDVVAHHISMIAVQAETARLTTPGLPAAGAQRFAEIGDTARAGLTEMRRLLGVLREDVDGRRRRPAAAAGAGAAGRADRRRQGGLGGSRPADRVRPGRVVRPRRRAGRLPDRAGGAHQHQAARARHRGRRRTALLGDSLRLRVRDNGPGPSASGSGHGLLGMRERAATVGGSLRTGPAPGGGFLVEAELPAAKPGET